MVASKTIFGTDLRIIAAHVTQEQSLAKVDPDTGLQYNVGPSRNRYITASARRYFPGAMLQASLSKADARDLSDGTPVPEAPRLIFDILGTLDRLPWHLSARAEFEEVASKPLGDGFVGACQCANLPAALLRAASAKADWKPASTSKSPAAIPAKPWKAEGIVGVLHPQLMLSYPSAFHHFTPTKSIRSCWSQFL